MIVAIDFEASCLPRHGRSYPIEVGIAGADGRRQSWLIQPHRQWVGWDWTDEAQALHGIQHQDLLDAGLSAAAVARQLKGAVAGHRLLADSQIDAYWLQTLLQAAGMPAFAHIEHVGALFDELGATSEDIWAAQAVLERQPFQRHRAGDDAFWLMSLVTLVENAVERRTTSVPTIPTGRLQCLSAFHAQGV